MNYKIELTFIVSVKKIQQIDYGEGNDLFLFPVHQHHHFKIETFEVV